MSPENPSLNLRIRELWSIGGEGDDDVLLEFPNAVIRDGDDILILDTKASMVYRTSETGGLLDVLDVSGPGPGQCDHPGNLIIFESNKYGLVRGMPGKIIVTDFKGRNWPTIPFALSRENVAEDFVLVNSCKYAGGFLLAFNEAFAESGSDYALSVFEIVDIAPGYQRAVQRSARLLGDKRSFSAELPAEKDIPHCFSKQTWDITAGGLACVAPNRDDYLIRIIDINGDTVRELERPQCRRYERTADELEYMAYAGLQMSMDVEKCEPAILGLRFAGDDQIWVHTPWGDHADVYRTYEEIDMDGGYLRDIRIEFRGSGIKDDLYFLGDGLVAVVKGRYDVLKRGYFGDHPQSTIKEDIPQVILGRLEELSPE